MIGRKEGGEGLRGCLGMSRKVSGRQSLDSLGFGYGSHVGHRGSWGTGPMGRTDGLHACTLYGRFAACHARPKRTSAYPRQPFTTTSCELIVPKMPTGRPRGRPPKSPPAPSQPPSPRRPPGHAHVRQVVSEWLEARPAVFQQLLAKAQGAARAADAAKKARDLVRRKTSLTRSTLPGKLADCTSEITGCGGSVRVKLGDPLSRGVSLARLD